jgi:dTDP-glucose 4,6-dehydratase
MVVLVTGGAGFIGSNFILRAMRAWDTKVINFDKLTYAGNLKNLAEVENAKNYEFCLGDICDTSTVLKILRDQNVQTVVNFAAESHVDRSINSPSQFMQTNIIGTFNLLEAVREYLASADSLTKESFRLVHVSTDEVYGSLTPDEAAFVETNRLLPNSPYAASKASSDLISRSYAQTFGLPIIITNCSNNFGPRQYPEKLVPVTILNALRSKPIPIYGNGLQVRDWLFVDDHCDAIMTVCVKGRVNEVYNIGGGNELTNIEFVGQILAELERQSPSKSGSYSNLINFVDDRLGHDVRYAINSQKIWKEFGWKPKHSLAHDLRRTITWYLENSSWVAAVENRSSAGTI